MLLISSRMTTVLPTPAPPNAPTLPPFVKGQIKIDDLDAGLEDRRLHVLVGQLRRLAMNRVALRESDRAAIINRIAGDVKNAAQRPLTDRDGNRAARVGDRHAALQTFGRGHGDGTDPVFAEMLLHFEGEFGRVAVDLEFEFERVIDPRDLPSFIEIHINNGADDLDDITFVHKQEDRRGETALARGSPKVAKLDVPTREKTGRLQPAKPPNIGWRE